MASVARYKTVPSMNQEKDDGLYQTLDEDSVLSALTNETSSSKRASILEALRNSVRRSGGRLQMQERFSLFNAIHNVLLDNDVNTRLACLNFICEVIPDFGQDLDDCMGLILPQLVVFIGHNQINLKRLAVQTLHVYMKYSRHLEKILHTIIQLGLNSDNVDTQRESLTALPILITPNFSGEDLFLLTEALVEGIAGIFTRRVSRESFITDTTSLALISLDKIRTVIGRKTFDEYIQRLSPSLQSVLNNAMKAAENNNEKTRKTKSANGIPCEDQTVTKSILNRSSTNPTLGTEPSNNHRNHTYLPLNILLKLKDPDWRLKMQGTEELKIWFEKDMVPSQFAPHLVNFSTILKELLNDSNFKVNLTSLQLVCTMVEKLGDHILTILPMMVNVLADKLGDNKNVMKQTNMQVFQKLMQNLSPRKVLSLLKPHMKHQNSRIREETLNIIIAALLTFPSNEFDLPQITESIAPALVDSKRRVRHAAMEAFAVISQAMGALNFQPMVSAIDKVELENGGEGLMAAINARCARRQLPKLTVDGLVEYALILPNSGSVKSNPNLAAKGIDVDWVLAGGGSSNCPSSARSTPGVTDNVNGSSPRRHFSAGKYRWPWDNGDKTENVPPKIENLWGVEDRQSGLKMTKNVKDTPSNEPIQPSYSEKYNARKISMNNPDISQVSNPSSSYAQQHKMKIKSAGLLSTKTGKTGGLNPLNNKTNGYSMIYKKGSLGGQSSSDYNKSIDVNNNPNKLLVKSAPIGVFRDKSPTERSQGTMLGFNGNLTGPLPDWPNRPRKLLSPVSPSSNHDDDVQNLNHNRHASYESPIPTKPALVGSASRKGRTVRSSEFSDTSPRLSDMSSPTQLSPVPPREHVYDAQRYKSKHVTSRSHVSQDYDHNAGRQNRSTFGSNTWSPGSKENDRPSDSVPFDTKPRIARTPVQQQLKRRLSLEFPTDSTSGDSSSSSPTKSDNSRKISHQKVSDNTFSERKKMEVVGHAFDKTTLEPKSMQSTLNSTSGVGSSLEESGEIGMLKNGKIGLLDPSSSDEKEDSTTVEDMDDYEFEYEDDSESGEDVVTISDTGAGPSRVKEAQLLQQYEQHVDKLDQDGDSSESMYDGSDGDSLEDSDGYEDDDEGFSGYPQGSSRNQRQSLSKSTRERMEHKRLEEEERRSRARQRIEEVERQNQLQLESKEQSFRDRLAKEQLEIENLIKRKEKERELEKLKQEKLQRQLEKKEDSLREEFRRSKSYIDEIEKAKEMREKERAEKLKKLQQKREKDSSEVKGIMSMDNNLDSKDLAIQGHHTPSRAAEVVTKPPVSSSSKKKLSSHQSHATPSKAAEDSESSAVKRAQVMSASSSSSLPTWEIPGSDLRPFSNGETAVKSTLKQLEGDDWESKCKGLLCVRRLVRHHPQDVTSHLHLVVQAVIAEVKNLRSQVSRAAIFTLGDMFSCLEKHMDMGLELTTKVLLKKAGESSGFIREDVERALGCLVSSVTASKAINALVSGSSGHRNVHVRKTAAQFLCMLAERMGPSRCLSGSKDVTETILVATAAFASDNGAETRYYGRRILHMLDNHEDFERMLNKYLPAKTLNPTMTIVDTLRTKGLGDMPGDSSSAKVRKQPAHVNNNGSSRSSSMVSSTTDGTPTPGIGGSPNSATSREGSRKHARRISHEVSSPQDQEDLANLTQQFSSNDWKERMQAIDKLVYLCEQKLNFVTTNFVKILDGFNPRLSDNNSKVNLHALQSLHAIIPILKENLNGSMATLVPSVAKNLASKNNNIVMVAEDVLDSFIEYIDNTRLLQPLCQFISLAPGGLRSRPSAVSKLLVVISDVYPRKPNNVVKHGLPVLWTLLGTTSSASCAPGNTKTAVTSLCQLLHSLMGNPLFEHAAAKSQRIAQKLKGIVNE